MINLKTMLVLLAFVALCYGDEVYKKKKHHHHMHYHFLYYLTFLAIKLKIVFFLGTIFTISLIAGKVIALIKLTEYMKRKDPHHEEKIVYVNPHEHQGHDFGGYSGGYETSKAQESYPPDFSVDHPPDGAEINYDRYGPAPDAALYSRGQTSSRSNEYSLGSEIYSGVISMAHRLRQLNITDMALNEMGIKDDNCKKKFVCKADYNARQNIVLRGGFDVLRDVSYTKYKPNATITSEADCETLYQQCQDETPT